MGEEIQGTEEVKETLEVGESDQTRIDEFLEDQPLVEQEGQGEKEEVTSSTESVEEKVSTEEPTGEGTSIEVKVGEGEVVKGEETEESKIAKLESQIESLQLLVDKLAGPKEVVPSITPAEVVPKAKNLNEVLAEVDFDKVMESKEEFTKFFVSAMEIVQEQTAQKILSSIPNIVGSHVQRQTTLRDVAIEFYNRYPELKRVKRYVGTVANEIYAANPEMTLGQVMEEAARVAKETLNIKAAVETKERKEGAKPALPGSGGGSRMPSKPSSKLQSEIDELLVD